MPPVSRKRIWRLQKPIPSARASRRRSLPTSLPGKAHSAESGTPSLTRLASQDRLENSAKWLAIARSGFADGADHDFEDFAVGEVYVFEDVEDAAPVAGAEAAEFGV